MSAAQFQLPALPYADSALDPVVSARTVGFHYGKHHKAYVDKTNELIQNTEFAGRTLEEIVQKTAGNAAQVTLFNNAAQVWNHTFYWSCMKPSGGGAPGGALARKIDAAFGSFDAFKKEFVNAALGQFGSGWAWLVKEGDAVKIVKTGNADTPIARQQVPLITVDVWEHAYYLDWQNRRKDYVEAWLDKLANWAFAEKNLG